MAWIQNNTTMQHTEMTNNEHKFESELYFCELNTGEFFTLWFDGINFYSDTKQYKLEEIKTYKKVINYEQP
jgi:hypothetical protein